MERSKFHFTPQKGWINDPNGMVYIDGEYHLFYQHYPEDIVWGPMHWGHAVSRDLLHWEHKEIALYPDRLGYIFSGSCIYDKKNVSGLGTKDTPPLIAFFTHHDPESGRQQQSIAYSMDKEHFVKYEGNPIIPNMEMGKKDFRDPKVFENPLKGGYTMAVAAGKEIEFYHSDNLLKWERTGSFEPGAQGNGYSGICECPDCFPMETDEGLKWVLLVSMCLSEEDVQKAMDEKRCASAHVMQYYIGEFNGDTFKDTVCAKEPLLFEYGTDHYAAVTFAGCPERILLGWGENWNYIKETPPGIDWDENGEIINVYRGKMTLARKLALVDTRFGYCLKSEPLGVKNSFCMHFDYKEECEVLFYNETGERFQISVMQDRIVVDRSACGVYEAVKRYEECEKSSLKLTNQGGFKTKAEEMKEKYYDILCAPRFYPAGSSMDIVYDEGYFEIFAEDGLAVFSMMTYPRQPFTECNTKMYT